VDKDPGKSSVKPGNGPDTGGTTVTITGTDLSGVTGVTFGGAAGTKVVAAADGKSLTVVTPKQDAGVVDVVLTNSAGSATLSGGFRFDATPHPGPVDKDPGKSSVKPGNGPMVLTGGDGDVGTWMWAPGSALLWLGLAVMIGCGVASVLSLVRRFDH
jgi:hypothetical protein